MVASRDASLVLRAADQRSRERRESARPRAGGRAAGEGRAARAGGRSGPGGSAQGRLMSQLPVFLHSLRAAAHGVHTDLAHAPGRPLPPGVPGDPRTPLLSRALQDAGRGRRGDAAAGRAPGSGCGHPVRRHPAGARAAGVGLEFTRERGRTSSARSGPRRRCAGCRASTSRRRSPSCSRRPPGRGRRWPSACPSSASREPRSRSRRTRSRGADPADFPTTKRFMHEEQDAWLIARWAAGRDHRRLPERQIAAGARGRADLRTPWAGRALPGRYREFRPVVHPRR